MGPKTDTIDAGLTGAACNSDCYFVVVYYERFDTLNVECYDRYDKSAFGTNEVIQYYPFISGFYWYGAENCYLCDSKTLELYFMKKFYSDAETEMPGIINDLSICYLGGQRVHCEGFPVYYYTVGKCLDSLGNQCGPGVEICCANSISVYSATTDTNNRMIDSIVSFPGGSGALPRCLPTCDEDCDTKKKSLLAGLSKCLIPCNDGPWTSATSPPIKIDSLLVGCTNCEITIHYSWRSANSPPCPDNYRDARFDSISYNCPSNCILQISPEEMVTYVNNWLLKYSALNNIQLGKCKDNFRLVNALCVTDYDTVAHTGLGNCNPLHDYQLGCCWGRYLVCKVGDDEYTATKIDGSEMIGDTCAWYTRPCVPICDEVNNSLAMDPNNPFGENSFEEVFRSMELISKAESLVITSVEEGKLLSDNIDTNVELLIYDIYGKIVGNRNTLSIVYEHLNRGTYFINVKNKENVLKIYKIYIEK